MDITTLVFGIGKALEKMKKDEERANQISGKPEAIRQHLDNILSKSRKDVQDPHLTMGILPMCLFEFDWENR